MNRLTAVIAILAIFAVGCGVDRASEDVAVATEVATDGEGDEAAATTLPAISPPTTGAPDEIAVSADFGDGITWELTYAELNELVVSTQEDEEFVNLVFQGVAPPDFALMVAADQLFDQAVRAELSIAGGDVSDDDLAESEQALLAQVEALYAATSTDPVADAAALYDRLPYLEFLVGFQAAQNALSAQVVEGTDQPEVPCVSHILVDTEPEAQDILTRLDGGEDFAALAQELSTGPSGPGGGDLGCADSANYVPEFRDAVDTAEVGEFVGPTQTDFGFHVLVVNGFEAAEADGRALATQLLQNRIAMAEVEVDTGFGVWDPVQLTIVPGQ